MEEESQTNQPQVSLPGVGGAEPTIIETLNKNTISNKTEENLQQDKSENKEEIHQSDIKISEKEEASEQEEKLIEDKTTEIQQNKIQDINKQEDLKNIQNTNDNIFDIQSHLIETFDKNFSVSEDIDKSGVTVKEIPAKPEEFQRTSQIETETSPKSVIEIEPSIPKIHKPIQLELDLSSIKRESKLFDSIDKDDNNIIDTDNLNNNINNLNTEEKQEVKVKEEEEKKQEDTAKEIKIEISNKFIEKEKDNIESSHIENNNNNKILAKEEINLEFQNTSDNSSKNKNDSEKLIEAEKQKAEEINIIIKEDSLESNQHKNIDKIIDIESSKVLEQAEAVNNKKIESNLVEKEEEVIDVQEEEQQQQTQEKFRVPQNILDTVENFVVIIQEREDINPINRNSEISPIDISNNLNISRGINGLQNCTTPLEEEEKKKLLDSLPQLDENIDPHKLSIEAKKEYYQSLRDYLDKYQYDKPPVPLQTYRWEDLRRAKEKGGYPWTYLYKRPLGPTEEPEIVLLLRKSQEFNFHKHHNHQASESPKSLKKVRIHDQVLVKETERYISDLSDTEDLSSKTSSPSLTGASTESEEDNKSALSESCVSDSVSEGKKSKLSKLKGILKRTEREEDNRSALSESCASDSVSEGKKSNLSKLKGILKLETGDKKKSKDNKQKESIEAKNSVKSKETTRLSSTSPSPSPLPPDIADSSDIISDEYQTPTTTESEGPSDLEREEDSRSALSESCASDSVSDGKKSKFSKFKEILKRETGDKKKSQESKQKEATVVKESTESKTTATLSSVSPSPSPLPSDIPNLSDKVSEQYQTPKTTKLEDPLNQECEEDNKSALSESCLSDSVSEGKKSKFNKFKDILKRESGDKKKFQDNKQKEPTEVKESTESQTSAALSSEAPSSSSLPSDILSSSDIISEEYQRPKTTKLEGQSDLKREEDKGNALGESCVSDSVSEDKKSKFSKFKEILKLESGDKKKSQENKQKEAAEEKHSTEPKTTEEIASESLSPSSDDYKTEGRSNKEREEDNKSALSESFVSDSVSEGKKSRFSKFKDILKRETGEKKDNKQKEPTEVKESTESKTPETLSSASPSPLPTDIPDSSVIVIDEYQTSLTTEIEGRSNKEREEDNKSALSESFVSDSVSEGKKSKFSKFKDILKRETGEKKDNKQKEPTEVKESTESKTPETLSSASPSPLPTDIPDSSVIIIDEYQTSLTTEIEGRSDKEREEDNKSALSESFVSDSVSEGKKSRFSKFKDILKRETGEKKDNKQKEPTEVKESTESKTPETLSSASPSPLPTDIPDSSVIVIDEYQTSLTTEIEGRSNKEREEDNKSALSESFVSDSVSEGKKSRFSKFKDILKRETGEKKDNKQKEPTEVKESTESKTPETFSSASSSPLPSDIPDSSVIVIAEYQTSLTTEIEGRSDKEREEDNKSALSESFVSDSVSEGKKSRFSKLKDILKRETGDKKDNKQKEPTEVKESTESKTPETLSSASPSPLPSDIPNSSGTVIDEYQTSLAIEIEGRPDKEREEDNKSALSESFVSDSVSEGKKSRFSKFKDILKRETGEKKDNKQKETTEVKESTESKTPETLSSASPSPLPSDIPDSGVIVIDEYQTSFTTKIEGRSDKEREEDNKSALSETFVSESVSEGKKSRFSKFKDILKRETGEKKDNKQKEPTEVKESTESKTPETLSSASPSPLPSDIPDSSVIVIDEYQTSLTTEIEGRSDKEREEDNKSALSESFVSDSVSEGKKSRFSKFKDILKRETGEQKDNKQKESTEVKESTESKTPETLSSASPSPLPSDIPDSGVIVIDEYQTSFTSEIEGRSDKEREEDNKSALSESFVSDSVSEGKKSKFNKFKEILKRETGGKKKSQDNKQKESSELKPSTESKESATVSSASPSPLPSDIQNLSDIVSDEYHTPTTTELESLSNQEDKTKAEEPTPKKGKCCHPIMDKIKTMADKHIKKHNIKKISLKGDEKIVLEEEQKILKLRESPKSDRSEIPKFVEKQDSEDIVEIVQLEESPSLKRKEAASIVVPDEIIELPQQTTVKVQISQANGSGSQSTDTPDSPPKKTLRKMKDHVYEEIDPNTEISMKIDEILELASVEALKKSLAAQDQNIIKDVEVSKKMPLDRMGSSEEEVEKSVVPTMATLAPISSIDSTSSDEQDKRILLSTVSEESDAASIDETSKASKEPNATITVVEEEKEIELKPVLKKEPSPGPNGVDKKVTFSHVEDESEPLREDLETPEELKNVPNRWKDMT